MASFEGFVNSSTLNVIVPNVVLEFPPQDVDYSTWVRKLRSDKVERKRAFFGTSYGVLFFHPVTYTLAPISRRVFRLLLHSLLGTPGWGIV